MANSVLHLIAQELEKASIIALLPHINADGDALGSCLALALALESLGKQVDVLLEEAVSASLDFLPGKHLIRPEARSAYDAVLNVDNGDLARLGLRYGIYQNSPVQLSIDHHATNNVTALYTHVDVTAAATGEIAYDLITSHLKVGLTQDMALCLYTALVTDTGCFRYSSTSPKTLETAAGLLRLGIDFTQVIRKVYETVSPLRFYLMRKAMEAMKICLDGKLALCVLTLSDLEGYGAQSDDFDGLVNIGRSLEGVEVSLFLREEKPGSYRGNLRSNNYLDVSKVAEQLGGGGHKRASGFNYEGNDLDAMLEKIIGIIEGSL